MTAARAPLTAAEATGDSSRGLITLNISKRGSCMEEKSISLARVALSPIQNPLIPLFFKISLKLSPILSARPVINCCLTISKGFLIKFAIISAKADARMSLVLYPERWVLAVSQVQKKVKEQGKETSIWQEKPLNLLRAMVARFYEREEAIIRVLIVSRGQKKQSTAIPAIPPATPCLRSAITYNIQILTNHGIRPAPTSKYSYPDSASPPPPSFFSRTPSICLRIP